LLIHTKSNSQSQPDLIGTLVDNNSGESIISASVVIFDLKNNPVKNTISDEKGHFQFFRLLPANYILKITYIGYESYEVKISKGNEPLFLGKIKLSEKTSELRGITINKDAIPVQLKDDTTSYSADAFKTNPDANAQDLISKMPGITVENGTVKTQGEDVKKVLVDGKEFFGDDVAATLRNLPAEVVEKIQVFDRLSEQSQFTGFDDGQSVKTINVVTRRNRNIGQFWKIYAGYGSDNKYQAGANLNLFSKDHRFTLLGLSNNVNQQNFSEQDLLGLSSGPSGQRGGPGAYMGRGGGGHSGASSANNFMIGQQNGINTSNSLGLNYTGTLSSKINLSGSYFFNQTSNLSENKTVRNYFADARLANNYSNKDSSDSKNQNHRINLRLEYNIDSSNSIIFSPRASIQNLTSDYNSSSEFYNNSGEILSRSVNSNNSDNTALSLASNILYRHKFDKRGRTFSANISNEHNDKSNNSDLYALTNYSLPNDSEVVILQNTNNFTETNTTSLNISYTEPIGKNSIIQLSYIPSELVNNSDKKVNKLDTITFMHDIFDSILSNKFENRYFTNRAGISYRYRNDTFNFMIGVNAQQATLSRVQYFPIAPSGSINFNNILPYAMYSYKFSKSNNVRLHYRTNTNPPTINQMQNVLDNSNPLLLSIGNPLLKQDFSQSLNARYNHANAEKGRSLFLFLNISNTSNYVGNSTLIAYKDTLINNEISMLKGTQLNKPVNLDNNWNIRSMLTYGRPVGFIKSNINLNAGLNYVQIPGLINNITNLSKTQQVTTGVVISSNISENIDFALAYSFYYNFVENSINLSANDNYYSQTPSIRLNYIYRKDFVFNSTVNYTKYSGISQSINQEFLLWNAGLGYKFLKNNSGELKLIVFDILDQNKSIGRNVTETYIEDTQTKVLSRYFMLNFTYTLRSFMAPKPEPTNFQEERHFRH